MVVIYKQIDLGIPFVHQFAHIKTAVLFSRLLAGGDRAGAERGGLHGRDRPGRHQTSVDEGQNEAARALGMSWGQTTRRIVLPQAMRVIIPPTGNELISMLKTTSLVIAVPLHRRALQPDPGPGGGDVQPDPDAAGGLGLVPVLHLGADGRAVLPGALLRPRRVPQDVGAAAAGAGRRPGDRPGATSDDRRTSRWPSRWCAASRCASTSARCEVLKGISLTVGRGEVMCLVGPSGSGKSTFLRCINHLEQVTAGRL